MRFSYGYKDNASDFSIKIPRILKSCALTLPCSPQSSKDPQYSLASNCTTFYFGEGMLKPISPVYQYPALYLATSYLVDDSLGLHNLYETANDFRLFAENEGYSAIDVGDPNVDEKIDYQAL